MLTLAVVCFQCGYLLGWQVMRWHAGLPSIFSRLDKWSSRQAHNLENGGSNPSPAPILYEVEPERLALLRRGGAL